MYRNSRRFVSGVAVKSSGGSVRKRRLQRDSARMTALP